jgi:hypothetical protein
LAVALILVLVVPGIPAGAADCTMGEDGNGDLIIAADCTIPAGTYNITRDFVINNGVTVTAEGDTGTGTGVIINAGRDIDIQGVLSADSQGYAGEQGPGPGNNDTTEAAGSGAGHGGVGGRSGNGTNSGGITYGVVSAPVTLGSGGGDDSGTGGMQGGPGGGAIKLIAVNTITVAGTVSANGGNAIDSGHDAGAGSGGSVWLDAASIAGSGTLSAYGGNGFSYQGGGGGGGGRIAVTYSNLNTSSYTVNQYGGAGGNQSGYVAFDGGAGTYYVKGATGNGSLTVDNGTRTDLTLTDQQNVYEIFDEVTISSGANYTIASGQTLECTTSPCISGGGTVQAKLTIDFGGTFDHQGDSAMTINELDIDNDGSIDGIDELWLSDSDFDHDGTFGTTLNDLGFTATYGSSTFRNNGSGIDFQSGLTLAASSTFIQEGSSLLTDSLTIESGSTFTQSTSSAIDLGELVIESGGNLNHPDNSTAETYKVNVTCDSLDLQSGGTINVAGLGYDTDQGPGKGVRNGNGASGAGHGGNGGEGANSTASGGPAYGSVSQPTTIGSGGAADNDGPGKEGGGAVKIDCAGDITVDGTISVNGLDVTGSSHDSGAGAGGSVWLDAATIAGTGTINAYGGRGQSSNGGGGGGGGRIALYYDNYTYTGSLLYNGGYGGNQGGYNGEDGGSGTLYLKDNGDTYATLTLDNNNRTDGGAATPQLNASETYKSVTIVDAAHYQIGSSETLTIVTGGSLTGSSGNNGKVTIDSGGTLDVTDSTYTIGTDITNNGTIDSVTDLTVDYSDFDHNGAFDDIVTNLTFASGNGASYFDYSGTGLNDLTLLVENSGTFVHGNAGYSGLTSTTVENGAEFIQDHSSTIDLGAVTIESGGSLVHSDNSTTQANEVDITCDSFDLESGATVNVSGLGYDSGYGPGVGERSGGGTGAGASGGGHGGSGGDGAGGGATGGAANDSVSQPVFIGSGGKEDNDGPGTSGGGYVKIDCTGSITVNGTISANGINVTGGTYDSGAGAGGTVWLDGATLLGSGTINAYGGRGQSSNGGGGGGGGRIAVYYDTDSSSISYVANGGYGGDQGGYNGEDGGAGTIYKKDNAQTYGDLIIDNNNRTDGDTQTPQLNASETYRSVTLADNAQLSFGTGQTLTVQTTLTGTGSTRGNLIIGSGGTLVPPSGTISGLDLTVSGAINGITTATVSNSDVNFNGTFGSALTDMVVGTGGNWIQTTTTDLNLDSLTIQSGGTFTQNHASTITIDEVTVESGGTLTHGNNSTSQQYVLDITSTTIDIQSGGQVDVEGLGFNQDYGTGKGNNDTNSNCGSGGGYGGAGAGACGNVGGITYGSETQPTDIGSGGGSDQQQGSAGGGAVQLTASGTLTVNGIIDADGANHSNDDAGAGSGGSIWLTAVTIDGSGTISADGGDSKWSTGEWGGGGGGGRIALYYEFLTHSGNRTVSGGIGNAGNNPGYTGDDGTIHLELTAAPPTVTPEVSPASPKAYELITLSASATDDSGVAQIDLYLNGTDPEDIVKSCFFDPASAAADCVHEIGLLDAGGYTLTAIATDDSDDTDEEALAFTVGGTTTQNSMTLSRLVAGEEDVDFGLQFTLNGADTGNLTVTFPAEFTVTGQFTGGVCAGGGTINTFTFDDTHLYAVKTACDGVVTLTGAAVTNPATPGAYEITWANDNGSGTVYITDDDSVSITGNVTPSLTFDLDVSTVDADSVQPYTLDLGSIVYGTPNVSDNSNYASVWIDLTTNAGSGAVISVASEFQALRSTSYPSDEIATASQALSTGSAAYGICVDGTIVGDSRPGDSISSQSPYGSTCDGTADSVVGTLQSTPQNLVLTTGPITNSRIQVRVGAAAGPETPGHPDYTDILTFIATGTF